MIVDAKTALEKALKEIERLHPPGQKSMLVDWLKEPEEKLEPIKQSIKLSGIDKLTSARVYATRGTGIASEEFDSKQLCHYVPRTPETAAVLKIVEQWTPEQGGLMLHGPVGTGKTHLVKGLLMKWAATGMTVSFTSVASLMDIFRDANTSGCGLHEVISISASPKLLALDDFGAEKPTEWSQEKFLALLDARLRHARPLMITSNLNSKQLRETYDIRILDRLKELVRFIHVPGESFRNEIYRRKL